MKRERDSDLFVAEKKVVLSRSKRIKSNHLSNHTHTRFQDPHTMIHMYTKLIHIISEM